MKPSQDLTLVLIRANGAPRTFNLPLPKLKRSLLFLSIFVLGTTLACITLAVLHFSGSRVQRVEVVTPQQPEAEKQPAAADRTAELQADLEKAQAALEGRKKLSSDPRAKVEAPLLLLAPTSGLVADSPVLINRPIVKRHENSKDVSVEFELQNRSPDQSRIRGYIVVIAKTTSGIYSYPENVFSLDENILLNFAKGETFGISRSRATVATFSDLPNTRGSKTNFQIFIFSSTGQILNTLHVPDQT